MANPNTLIADAAGLQTQPNELTLPAGALAVAKNMEITRDGIAEVARGFEDFSANLPDFTPEQIVVVGGVAYLNLDSGLWYYDTTSGNWLRKRGALGAKATQPEMVAVANNTLYYTANHCVLSIDLVDGTRSVIAGRFGSSGSADGTGDVARFTSPKGIAFDGTNLYVCDSTNYTIRKVAPPLTAGAAVVTTIAGTAGASGPADGTGAAARFQQPTGIAFDGTNLYVCDLSNHTIRRLAPPLTAGAAVVTTIAGTAGSPGSVDGTGAAARFQQPTGIAFDGTNLFVCDSANHTIRRLAPPLTAGAAVVTTIAGTAGSPGSVDGTGAAARFQQPTGIAFDGTNLFVCDRNDNTIRKIYPNRYVATISGVSGTTAVGFGSPRADGIVAGPT